MQVSPDARFAVAAVGGGRARRLPGVAGDAFDGRGQLRRVGRVSDLDVVVEDDTVGVVDELGFVAELDRLAEAPLADRGGRQGR